MTIKLNPKTKERAKAAGIKLTVVDGEVVAWWRGAALARHHSASIALDRAIARLTKAAKDAKE